MHRAFQAQVRERNNRDVRSVFYILVVLVHEIYDATNALPVTVAADQNVRKGRNFRT